MKANDAPIEYLRECFDYDSATGELTWKERPAKHFKNSRQRSIFNNSHAGKKAGWLNERGYLNVSLLGKALKAHRVVWALTHGSFPAESLDHINGDKADNRIANLRLAECAQNQWNTKRSVTNTSGYKGVHRKFGRWAAYITVRGKRLDLGLFETPEAAYAARCDAAERLHGQFANHGHPANDNTPMALTTQGASHG